VNSRFWVGTILINRSSMHQTIQTQTPQVVKGSRVVGKSETAYQLACVNWHLGRAGRGDPCPGACALQKAGAEVWCSHGNVGEQRPECQRCGIVTGVKRGFCSNMLLTSSLRRHTGLHGLDWLDAQFLGHLPFHLVIPRFISQI
jgi:hypothetical protein